ncbi:MarR family transcriptional regulator [Agathobaculum sp. NTUH-O15-33]|uniref:MarR family winged helix-turn-helix transcriptional regulator n=1 Tax=Agathobaculum sp. NTUH-O15-33 TaxID=3079302 RepID=UPI0029589670|nr:MarR family transcriptional regulator [Agathobaculum sp. NTUH-O15-33]WNX85101.1 MarR family transcriptional regulator [Agathobaculum sp. NTUH-O15-33]
MSVPLFYKYASILHRCGNRFYDQALASFGIGCGQQFFLSRIAEHEGITMYDLAALGRFDKGTVTRAVQKLEELGYLRSEVDARDRRIRHLYTTSAAGPALLAIMESRREWVGRISEGLSPEEIKQAESLFARLVQNACQCNIEEGERENS